MPADLAKALVVELPQAVRTINKLESRGLAMRIRGNPDKRSYGLFLSNAGEHLVQQLQKIALQSDLESTAVLAVEEREQLLTLLHKLYCRD